MRISDDDMFTRAKRICLPYGLYTNVWAGLKEPNKERWSAPSRRQERATVSLKGLWKGKFTRPCSGKGTLESWGIGWGTWSLPNLYWQRGRSSVSLLPPSDYLVVFSLGWIQLETTEQGHRFIESLKVSFQDTEQRVDEWRMGLERGGKRDLPTGVGENATKVTHDPQLV